MNIQNKYYILRLIKENIMYLGLILMLFVVSMISIAILNSKNEEIDNNINTISQELSDLQKKKEFIEYSQYLSNQNIDINDMNLALSKLIPDTEDYFSIILAFEKISSMTNFVIHAYQINLQKSSPTRLSLNISGVGSTEDFLNFLNNYNFSGERLITINKINFSNQGFEEIRLDVNFYTSDKRYATKNFVKFTENDLKIIKDIQQKVKVNIKEDTNSEDTYRTKSNPF